MRRSLKRERSKFTARWAVWRACCAFDEGTLLEAEACLKRGEGTVPFSSFESPHPSFPGLRFFPEKSYPAIQRARIYGKIDWRFGGKLCADARASLYWRMMLRETGCRWKLCLWAAVLVRACPWLRPGVKSCAGHSTVGIRLPKNIPLRIAARAGRCAETIKRARKPSLALFWSTA